MVHRAGRLGIDVGGTFVDFALSLPSQQLLTHKVLADPGRLADSVLQGLTELAGQREQSLRDLFAQVELIVHGTTVATNAVLEQSGARTALLTTKGTRDVLEMRRGVKEEPLNNRFVGPPPLVPRHLRLGVAERIDSAGTILEPLDEASLAAAVGMLERERVEAVAICLMHGYANPVHERRIADAVQARLPDVYVTLSSELMPRLGYYSRVSTTVINSYVGPLLSTYLAALWRRLEKEGYEGSLLIMNSSGGVTSPAEISRRAASALASGPAAGPIAGRLYAAQQGQENCAVVDMGGTSLDVSLVSSGEPLVTTEGQIGLYSLALPTIDLRTLGAGGGSIGWLDLGGVLHMGPQSAGAYPGPACYGNGGRQPTCTDADLLLGYIDPDYFLGGRLRLDSSAAEAAIRDSLASPLHSSVEAAAIAMFEVINANMATGIRDMLVDRGSDPGELPLVVGGGAGPIHAGMLAADLGIGQVIIPRVSGVLCASGMLFSDLKHDFVQSYFTLFDQLDPSRWRGLFESMEAEGRRALLNEGARDDQIELLYAADLRYVRQLHELTLPLGQAQVSRPSVDELHAAFDAMHDRLFGYNLPDHRLELVNVRLTCIGRLAKPELPRLERAMKGRSGPRTQRRAYLPDKREFAEVSIYEAEDVAAGCRLPGPVIVETAQTTIVVPGTFELDCDQYGSFVLRSLEEKSG